MKRKLKLLFLCTGNSCRSQMAEGFALFYFRDKFIISSAGIESHGINPNAIKVMKEAGVDISTQFSKTVDALDNTEFDFVITVCTNADERCPVFSAGTAVLHKGFDDPPALARSEKTAELKLNHYRRVRDEIKEYIKTLPELLKSYRVT